MQFSKLHLVLLLVPSTLAQYGGGSDSTTTTSAAPAAESSSEAAPPPNVKVIDVGEDGLSFSPNTTSAAVGDTLEFHFYAPAHSVSQSSFDSPCVPLSNGTGFWSGGITTASGENPTVWSVLVNDTNPIWFYCAVPTHCESGMAGVVNPPSDAATSLKNYVAAAKKVGTSSGGTTVQGGTFGKEAVASTSAAPASSSSASSSSSKGAGVETRGDIHWVLVAMTGAFAAGMGMLMI